MGMDALTATALDSLIREALPKLAKRLADLAKQPVTARHPGSELGMLLAESQELLSLIANWENGAAVATAPTHSLKPVAAASDDPLDAVNFDDDNMDTELNDDDAMAMLAAMDEPKTPAKSPAPVAPTPPTQRATANPDPGPEGELSDDEAMALLASMDSTPIATNVDAAGSALDDDEARALLAEMDAPLTPAAPATGTGEMSDAEARALLADMDAPSATAAAGGDMSDDEARALLADMDAPAQAASKPNAPKAAAPKAAAVAAPTGGDDDEVMAMLRSMGGMENDNATPTTPVSVGKPAAAAPAAPRSGTEEDEEKLDELPEFAKNEFASDPEMMNDFVTNTDEIMETLDTTILQLEQNPKDRETIESIFRAAHTLKGAAGMFGFKSIERVMHRMENLFDQVRKGALVPDSNIIDVVFQGLDVLRALLGAVKNGKPSGQLTVPIVLALEKASQGKYVKGSVAGTSGTPKVAEKSGATSAAGGGGTTAAEGGDGHGADDGGATKKKSAEQSTIRVDLERLDALVNLVGELVIDRTRFVSIEEEIRTTQPQTKTTSNMSETVQLFGRHMNEIHDIVMKIRMVPIGNAFNKFQRVVRDIARQLGKEIELYVDGEDTELDKTLVEQIGDPLIHLIRNSCDHGVEMPDVRAAAGKRRSGSISLSARQEGNHIIITIQDDGKGIPVDIIRKKAIEKGLITEEMVLSKRDVLNLIFEPGFSTAEKVTNLSGRGVGMDVVRKQISKLKGMIDLDSETGKGTTTTIRLPLTLAIMQSLLVESAGETFAIPLSTVVESVRIKPQEIQNVGDAEVIKRHGKVLPLMHLHETLDLNRKNQVSWYCAKPQGDETSRLTAMRIARRKERLYVVIVGSGDRRFGIVVDQLLNQQEMVIKSLGTVLRKTPCVAGGAVLGNGEVVLVLDIQELAAYFRAKTRSKAA